MNLDSRGLRVAFAGTPEFAAAHLQALLETRHSVVAVYTQPDRPAGRGRRLTPSPVKSLAAAAGIEVRQPPSLKDPIAQAQLAELQLDVLVVVAYGLILPQAVLNSPRYGCLNVHGSLLPRWRGAAPIQRAIEAGDDKSGICIMGMEAGLDTGPVLAVRSIELGADTTAAVLHDQLIELGSAALLEVLDDLPAHLASAIIQDDTAATYAHKITKAEAAVDWQKSSAAIHHQICAFNPFPVCWSNLQDERVKIWQSQQTTTDYPAGHPGEIVALEKDAIIVACGNGHLRLLQLQFPGGKSLPSSQLLLSRSQLLACGNRFS
ncbi:methionyl-tRNA formyltransferase [Halieaceae bacterium IMCC14734]|uniref:Methionyl-tRNA formyltransferase n=1 Tax=Candidatus Litorirhabdus singularis TaxID=2518993 RepID=A0ABT3TDU5_9GAMM|nr:methionyl-tRNA formyltransferase [Candidatus Litorirhabdus singularis]MCX2979951.1 methionyl-tRNA formyltransferase [Candidatus Litorirhabdus singularis]